MRSFLLKLFITVVFSSGCIITSAQLVVTPMTTPLALAQTLVGNGVTISNVTFTGRPEMAGHFINNRGSFIPIDSGIVLTSGRAMTADRDNIGVNGDGSSRALDILASNPWGLPGDPDLANEISNPDLHDACVLEFDFTPLGDSVQFNYIFSSEEYTPAWVCSFNDAFAFFISGPGIPGLRNIALVPLTTIPVSIFNVNNVPGGACPNNMFFYTDNRFNRYMAHDGHTKVFAAIAKVTPCETYHLKIVIADAGDSGLDSGVFLQAKSLSSNALDLTNNVRTDPRTGRDYLAEGCATGSFTISRPKKDPVPLTVNLSYGGTATNGVDMILLPPWVTIPSNDSFVRVDIIPTVDLLPEGIEEIRIYALSGCGTIPADSAIIQIRDYEILDITPDTAVICRGNSVQLIADPAYGSFQWSPDPTLSSTTIGNPFATPVEPTTYTCIATQGTCNAIGTAFITLKAVSVISKSDVNCSGGMDGQVTVMGATGWIAPVEYSIDGINWQPDGVFNGLGAGDHWIKVRDGSCMDSVMVSIIQAFPDLLISNVTTTPAGCSGDPDGTVTITGTGGNGAYTYSIDGINYQTTHSFNITGGPHTIYIKDGNGCVTSQAINVPYNTDISVDAGPGDIICEGDSYQLQAVSNASSISWTPAASLDNSTLLAPVASPSVTTKYYITATTGICIVVDSVVLTVRPAPIANAGPDMNICSGRIVQLNASGGVSYQWSPPTNFISPTTAQNPDVRVRDDISYSLMVKDIHNCESLVPDIVAINVTATVRIFAGNDTVAAFGQTIQLNVRERSSAGVTHYIWTPATGLSNATIPNPTATLTSDQRYMVTGTTADGCQGTDDILVKVYKGPEIYVPSGFTPNNDGLNDLLRPIPVGIKEFRHFRVYNRWGTLIFSTQDPRRGWDGKIRGVDQDSGSFVWFAEAVDYKGNLLTRKGVVTLLR